MARITGQSVPVATGTYGSAYADCEGKLYGLSNGAMRSFGRFALSRMTNTTLEQQEHNLQMQFTNPWCN